MKVLVFTLSSQEVSEFEKQITFEPSSEVDSNYQSLFDELENEGRIFTDFKIFSDFYPFVLIKAKVITSFLKDIEGSQYILALADGFEARESSISILGFVLAVNRAKISISFSDEELIEYFTQKVRNSVKRVRKNNSERRKVV